MLHAEHIRAARALLNWRQEDLSQASGVALATIYRIEKTNGPVMGNVSTVMRLQHALEQAGVVLLQDADGIGLRLTGRKQKVPKNRGPKA